MPEIFYHKAIDMTLLDYFAIHAPEPSDNEMNLQRSYDLNKAKNNDRFVARNDRQIKCELRYEFAKAMMKGR